MACRGLADVQASHRRPACRCKTVGSVCSWWRAVSLEACLLQDLNLNGIPLFARRERELPGWVQQRKSFLAWLMTRRASIR